MGRRAPIERTERIELIDPRDPTGYGSAFAPSPPPAAPPPKRRSSRRWGRIAAPVALVAIVAAVAIAVTATNDDRGSPGPSTVPSTATSTRPPGTSTVGSNGAPAPGGSGATNPNRAARLVGTLPTGFEPVTAYEFLSSTAAYPGKPISAALWASAIDAARRNSYVEVTAAAEPRQASDVGTIRVDTPLGAAVADVRHGEVDISGPTTDGWAKVTSIGLTLGEATHVLETVRTDAGRVVVGGVAVPAGLHLVGRSAGGSPSWEPLTESEATSTDATSTDATSTAATSTSATSTSTTSTSTAGVRRLSVAVGPRMTAYQQTVEWFFMSTSRSVDVGGLPATLGASGAPGGRRLSLDRDGLHVVVTASGIEDVDLVTYARSLHVADDATWQALLDLPDPDRPHLPASTLAACAGGTLPGLVDWSAKCGIDAADPARLEVELDTSTPNGPLFATSASVDTATASIAASATDRLTYVAAAVPAGASDADLVVRVGDVVVATGSFGAVTSSGARLAVVAFTELGPFTAQITTADGTALATYDPLAVDSA